MVLQKIKNKKTLAFIGLLGGILLVALSISLSKGPAHSESNTSPITLTVIEAQTMPFVVSARGYGVTRPVQTWQAVANVAGRVIERHPQLNSGTLLPAGTLLLALDPSRYQLAITEVEAEIASLNAEQIQLKTETKNTQQLLALETERLQLSQKELDRVKDLFKTGAV